MDRGVGGGCISLLTVATLPLARSERANAAGGAAPPACRWCVVARDEAAGVSRMERDDGDEGRASEWRFTADYETPLRVRIVVFRRRRAAPKVALSHFDDDWGVV